MRTLNDASQETVTYVGGAEGGCLENLSFQGECGLELEEILTVRC